MLTTNRLLLTAALSGILLTTGCHATGYKSVFHRKNAGCQTCQEGEIYYENNGQFYNEDGQAVPSPLSDPGISPDPTLQPVPMPPGTSIPPVPGEQPLPPPPAPASSAWQKSKDWFHNASVSTKNFFQR